MKLRYWYKIDHKKQPIPGSNVRRKSRPGATHQWKEILDPCCLPADVSCTCGPRYFVQLDGRGKPVDGTLIKRNKLPEMLETIKYYELPWKSVCCGELTFDFGFDVGAEGTFTITVNGISHVNTTTALIGVVAANLGDEITVTLNNGDNGNMDNVLGITGGEIFNSTSQPATHTFTWNGLDTEIQAYVTLQENSLNWSLTLEEDYSVEIDFKVNGVSVIGFPITDPVSGTFGVDIGDEIEVTATQLAGVIDDITIELSGSMTDTDSSASPLVYTFIYTGGELDVDIFVPTPV